MALAVAPAASAATVPALDPAALRESLRGLPDAEVSGALVRVTGSAGRWVGSGGTSRVGTRAPVHPDGRFR
ncbi:hypothetical protein [Saccharothrix sp. Mg75]|uniref:hypothetical protein n=1 Tax=Saccharothrix sp. Mg75 TaxID=3445357 RepID=UPI003EEBEADB